VGPGFTACCALLQSRTLILLGLLDLWGGGPCCVLEGDVLLTDVLFCGGGDRTGRQRPRLSDNTLRCVSHFNSCRGCDCLGGLG
jgi:hypothetical protein